MRKYSAISANLLLLVVLVAGNVCVATEIQHVPPPPTLDAPLEIVCSGREMKRARALVVRSSGLEEVALTKDGETFRGQVEFKGTGLLRYKFQAQDNAGRFIESRVFEIRQPADNATEQQIRTLAKDLEAITARERQVENAIHSLKAAEPEVLVRQKTAAMAKALLLLSQRERELRFLEAGKEAK